MLDKLAKQSKPYLYFVFRILVGFLFFQHGAQKLFGWFTTSSPVNLFSLLGFAGILEFFGGIAIVLGLFTSLVSFFTAIEMIYAYFTVHFPQGWIPIVNKGELALLYFVCFIVLFSNGSGIWSIDNLIFKKK